MKQSYPPVTTKKKYVREIAKRLILMAKLDQEIRDKYFTKNEKEYLNEMLEVDKANREEFKKIFSSTGLITSDYGEKAQTSAFLIVQHMPIEELGFMKKYLSLMKKNMDGYNPNHYAMLVDRIRTRDGKEQLYGTQFMPVVGKEKTYKLKELYKPHLVDKRRKELNLAPLGEYLKTIQEERGVTLIF